MNDEFLYRLRAQPSWKFASSLKTKLDKQTATADAAASKRRYLYLVAAFLIGGTALAFISPRVRSLVAVATDSFGDASTAPEPTNAVATTPNTNTQARPIRPTNATIRQIPALKAERPSTTTSLVTYSTSSIDNTDATTSVDHTAIAMRESAAKTLTFSSEISALVEPDTIRINGSSTVFPITEALAEEFQIQTHNKIRVTVGIAGTGGGFKHFCRGNIDIATASRPILKAEMEACAAAGIKFIELPIAYHAIAVVVNPKATWIEQITIGELKKMWEPTAQASMTTWARVNAHWPNQPLHLFGPDGDSGEFDFFTEVVNGRAKSSRGDYMASESETRLIQGVNQNPYALGYVSYGYYAMHADRLKALKIVNRACDAVTPSEDTIWNRSYTPLSRPLFIYVNATSAKRNAVKAFVFFHLLNGEAVAREVNYVPLTTSANRLVLNRFREEKLGTVFGSDPDATLDVEAALQREGKL